MISSSLLQSFLKHKAQPVGIGYIDIIVKRINYKEFISNLLNNGFIIEAISWWEECEIIGQSKYGQGGPKSLYYNCWFSEINTDFDEIPVELLDTGYIINLIENKKIQFPNDEISFINYSKLTPAIWIKVPDSWSNTIKENTAHN